MNKHPNLLHALRQLLHNLPRRLHANVPWTLLKEHKPHRMRPGLNCHQCILQIRHPTNLHPSHTHSCPQKVKTSRRNPFTVRSALATRYWRLEPAAPLPAAPPASRTPQSKTPGTPRLAAARYPLPTECRSPPPAPHSWGASPPAGTLFSRRPRTSADCACSLQSNRIRRPAPAAILPHHALRTRRRGRANPHLAPGDSVLHSSKPPRSA